MMSFIIGLFLGFFFVIIDRNFYNLVLYSSWYVSEKYASKNLDSRKILSTFKGYS